MNDALLKAENILKVYPNGIVANRGVNFEVQKGEIHALIGENGAGKSTLMKILFGIETPEEGTITLNGQEVSIDSPKKAISLGIGMVHQHFMLVDSLSIAENIALGHEPLQRGMFLDRDKIVKQAGELAERYHFEIDVNRVVRDASVGVKQKAEILKALARGAQILILDEPTAVLTPQETRELFVELTTLRQEGYTIIFISHKLKEVMEICDRITIMRHGRTVDTCLVKDTSPEEISRKMVGRDVVLHIEKQPAKRGDVCLETRSVTCENVFGKRVLDALNMRLRSGEVLGVAGVEGNGQSELAEILFGLRQPSSGEVLIKGSRIGRLNPSGCRRCKVAYIPEDRMRIGVAARESILSNMLIDKVDRYLRGPFLKEKEMNRDAEKLLAEFTVLARTVDTPAGMLSGGNIQKVVAAREMTEEAQIIIAEQPTRGIDPGASEIIRRKLLELRDKGAAVLLISADLNEILEMSDGVIVLHEGKINGYFPDTTALTEEELGYYMLGVKKQSRESVETALCG